MTQSNTLQIRLPDDLSDQALATFLELLCDLALEIELRYKVNLDRYHQRLADKAMHELQLELWAQHDDDPQDHDENDIPF